MDSNIKQNISNNINTTLANIQEYNPINFVEDSLQINNILKSELRNQSDFKLCLNKLRALIKSNKTLFCSLFTNLISSYLSILKSENMVPEEYMYVLVDILHNKSEYEKYFKKWVEPILLSLLKFYVTYSGSKDNEQISRICSYIEFWIDEFISLDENSINYLIFLFEQTNTEIQKMSAFFFFKYIYRYDINKIKKVDWKLFFGTCGDILDSNYIDDENKNVVNDIFKQILIYFNKLNVDPNDVLIQGESLNSAKYFQSITGFNMEKAKEKLRD